MALPPKTQRVIDHFNELPLDEAARFLDDRAARPLVDLLDSYYNDFNKKQLQKVLLSENDGAIDKVYEDIRHAARTYREPAKEPAKEKTKTPPAKKRADNAFTRTASELKALGKSGVDVVKAVATFDPLLFAKSGITFTTECITTALSATGLPQRARTLAVANISAWGSAYITGTLTAGFTALGINGAQASLPAFDPATINDFDSAAYAESLDSARLGEIARGPLEITITGGDTSLSRFNEVVIPMDRPAHRSGGFSNGALESIEKLDTSSVPGLKYKDNAYYFSLDHETWQVESALAEANLFYAQASGLPPWLYFATEAREAGSYGKILSSAYNKNSHACSAAQFVPSTLYQYVYQHAEDIGYGYAKELVKRTDKNAKANKDRSKDDKLPPYYTYAAQSKDAAKTLAKLCFDPEFSIGLKTFFMMDNIKSLQSAVRSYSQDSTYTLGSHEVYLAHLAGIGRTKKMLKAYFGGNDAVAATYFPKHVREMPANSAILYADPKNMSQPRKISEVLTLIADGKKFGREEVTLSRPTREIRNNIVYAVANYAASNQPRPSVN